MGDVLGWVEDREVLAEDLLFRVPLEPRRAVVPAQDVATGIQSEDGVIRDALDEQSIEREVWPERPDASVIRSHGRARPFLVTFALGSRDRRGLRVFGHELRIQCEVQCRWGR